MHVTMGDPVSEFSSGVETRHPLAPDETLLFGLAKEVGEAFGATRIELVEPMPQSRLHGHERPGHSYRTKLIHEPGVCEQVARRGQQCGHGVGRGCSVRPSGGVTLEILEGPVKALPLRSSPQPTTLIKGSRGMSI